MHFHAFSCASIDRRGSVIRVLELVPLPPRLRARLSHGWITLRNEHTGRSWAVRQGEEEEEEESVAPWRPKQGDSMR